MDNKKCRCSYRQQRTKLERRLATFAMILRFVLLIVRIWTFISG